MPVIYLKHPRHGLKIAISEMEVEHDETHGWVRYTPGTPDSQEPAAPANALDGRRRRRNSPQEVLTDGNSRGPD